MQEQYRLVMREANASGSCPNWQGVLSEVVRAPEYTNLMINDVNLEKKTAKQMKDEKWNLVQALKRETDKTSYYAYRWSEKFSPQAVPMSNYKVQGVVREKDPPERFEKQVATSKENATIGLYVCEWGWGFYLRPAPSTHPIQATMSTFSL